MTLRCFDKECGYVGEILTRKVYERVRWGKAIGD